MTDEDLETAAKDQAHLIVSDGCFAGEIVVALVEHCGWWLVLFHGGRELLAPRTYFRRATAEEAQQKRPFEKGVRVRLPTFKGPRNQESYRGGVGRVAYCDFGCVYFDQIDRGSASSAFVEPYPWAKFKDVDLIE